MTEPLDIDAIEAKARAYVEAYDARPPVNLSFKYLVDMLAAVRERDAEIARWSADYADTATCLNNERKRFAELLGERDAAIASLKMMIMKEEEMVGLLDEIARLRAPPGADASERSSRVWYTEIDGKPQSPGWTITAYARAIEQAQREATEAERRRCATIDHIDIDLIRREAREAAIEELGFGEIVMMSEQRNKPGLPSRWCALARDRKEAAMGDTEQEARLAALAAKPGSETWKSAGPGAIPNRRVSSAERMQPDDFICRYLPR